MFATAHIHFADSQCATPLRIDYAFPNSTTCTPTQEAMCSTDDFGTSSQHWSCVADLRNFGTSYFPNKVIHESIDDDCKGASVSAFQAPMGTCIPSTPAPPYTFAKLFIDPTNGATIITTYSDALCTSRVNVSSPISKECTKTQLLNYNGSLALTTYTTSDCTTPIKLVHDTSIPQLCTSNPTCTKGTGQEYTTTSCTNSTTLDETALKLFSTTPYFKFQTFPTTSGCTGPAESTQYVRLGTCFESSPMDWVHAINTSLSIDGRYIVFRYYAGFKCTGWYEQTLFPNEGGCVTNARVFYNTTLFESDAKGLDMRVVSCAVVGVSVASLISCGIYWWCCRKTRQGKTRISRMRWNRVKYDSLLPLQMIPLESIDITDYVQSSVSVAPAAET
ncbi:hypothetical protein BCR33DRAFT_718444 [Rhizoclosmatium globosum]|uniref:Uncharacterized protein n=1 Tax=Rhizoclosmatium globosum TaxID=329046 RepID=A0A1Y2C5U9_9FUNG|nr:hypothetical protein BCR33DRAFT_718444 [Rhizoclosmatium globosum]|eukprot:ORY42254.1 hypothetical protein BCR33DRAFT_718444 [Rhizoclosmatium globosum]